MKLTPWIVFAAMAAVACGKVSSSPGEETDTGRGLESDTDADTDADGDTDTNPCPEDDNPCNDYNPETGECETYGVPCSDGQWCSSRDVCQGGECIPLLFDRCIMFGDGIRDCDEENNRCYYDLCPEDDNQCNNYNPETRECIQPEGTPCQDDGIFCNGNEVCDSNGHCLEHTYDACRDINWVEDPEWCDETNRKCVPCDDDGIGCNGEDYCLGGELLHIGDPCADDPYFPICNEGDSGSYTCKCEEGTVCDDDQCTVCANGICGGHTGNSRLICDDENDDTWDFCFSGEGCKNHLYCPENRICPEKECLDGECKTIYVGSIEASVCIYENNNTCADAGLDASIF